MGTVQSAVAGVNDAISPALQAFLAAKTNCYDALPSRLLKPCHREAAWGDLRNTKGERQWLPSEPLPTKTTVDMTAISNRSPPPAYAVFVPLVKKDDKRPDYRITLRYSDIDAAWEQHRQGWTIPVGHVRLPELCGTHQLPPRQDGHRAPLQPHLGSRPQACLRAEGRRTRRPSLFRITSIVKRCAAPRESGALEIL